MNDDSPRREMSPDGRFDPERDGPLLSAYMDGELKDEQIVAVEKLLAGSEVARSELAGLRRVQEVAGSMRLKEAPAEQWEKFHDDLFNRAERSVGWLLVCLGLVVVGGVGLYELARAFFFDSSEPWYLKVGVVSLCFGVLLLFVSVIRERVYRRSCSRYKDVLR